MKKFLAILFLTIFTFQILPVKAIGKILWDSQLTEEVHEHGNCGKKMTNDNHDKLWYLHFLTATDVEDKSEICHHYVLRDEALIKCLHLDVLIQPPNFN